MQNAQTKKKLEIEVLAASVVFVGYPWKFLWNDTDLLSMHLYLKGASSLKPEDPKVWQILGPNQRISLNNEGMS